MNKLDSTKCFGKLTWQAWEQHHGANKAAGDEIRNTQRTLPALHPFKVATDGRPARLSTLASWLFTLDS